MNGLRPHVAKWERGLYQVMTRRKVSYGVVDKVRGPQVSTFRLRLADPGDLSKVLGLGEQLALTMGVRSVRAARTLEFVDLEISLPIAHHRALPVGALTRKGRTWVTLGQTATGTPVHVNLAGNRTCHALVSGITGSGKTVCEQLIAWTLATDNDPAQVNLLLIDGKKRAWWGFEREAHLAHPVIGDPNEAVAALTWCVTELDRRKDGGYSTPILFIVIDEVYELIALGGDPVAEAIRRVVCLGRELGIHIILATQHALTDAVGGSIVKANLPMRLTGHVADANAAYLATGVKGTGAESLQGNGDFLLTVAGESHRLQVALIGNREIGRLPRTESTPRLDFGDYDPARVLDVVDTSKAKLIEDEPEAVAYALATNCGVPTIRERYGPMGTKRAQRIRDFARALRAVFPKLGYIYPLPLTQLSQETAQKVGVQGYLVRGKE